MIIIAGTLHFATPEDRDGAVAASIPLQRATREQEPGCQAYVFAPDPVEPTVVQVYELWDDQETLAAHFQHTNYLEMRTALRSFMKGSKAITEKIRCDHREPVYDSTGTPRADFFQLHD